MQQTTSAMYMNPWQGYTATPGMMTSGAQGYMSYDTLPTMKSVFGGQQQSPLNGPYSGLYRNHFMDSFKQTMGIVPTPQASQGGFYRAHMENSSFRAKTSIEAGLIDESGSILGGFVGSKLGGLPGMILGTVAGDTIGGFVGESIARRGNRIANTHSSLMRLGNAKSSYGSFGYNMKQAKEVNSGIEDMFMQDQSMSMGQIGRILDEGIRTGAVKGTTNTSGIKSKLKEMTQTAKSLVEIMGDSNIGVIMDTMRKLNGIGLSDRKGMEAARALGVTARALGVKEKDYMEHNLQRGQSQEQAGVMKASTYMKLAMFGDRGFTSGAGSHFMNKDDHKQAQQDAFNMAASFTSGEKGRYSFLEKNVLSVSALEVLSHADAIESVGGDEKWGKLTKKQRNKKDNEAMSRLSEYVEAGGSLQKKTDSLHNSGALGLTEWTAIYQGDTRTLTNSASSARINVNEKNTEFLAKQQEKVFRLQEDSTFRAINHVQYNQGVSDYADEYNKGISVYRDQNEAARKIEQESHSRKTNTFANRIEKAKLATAQGLDWFILSGTNRFEKKRDVTSEDMDNAIKYAAVRKKNEGTLLDTTRNLFRSTDEGFALERARDAVGKQKHDINGIFSAVGAGVDNAGTFLNSFDSLHAIGRGLGWTKDDVRDKDFNYINNAAHGKWQIYNGNRTSTMIRYAHGYKYQNDNLNDIHAKELQSVEDLEGKKSLTQVKKLVDTSLNISSSEKFNKDIMNEDNKFFSSFDYLAKKGASELETSASGWSMYDLNKLKQGSNVKSMTKSHAELQELSYKKKQNVVSKIIGANLFKQDRFDELSEQYGTEKATVKYGKEIYDTIDSDTRSKLGANSLIGITKGIKEKAYGEYNQAQEKLNLRGAESIKHSGYSMHSVLSSMGYDYKGKVTVEERQKFAKDLKESEFYDSLLKKGFSKDEAVTFQKAAGNLLTKNAEASAIGQYSPSEVFSLEHTGQMGKLSKEILGSQDLSRATTIFSGSKKKDSMTEALQTISDDYKARGTDRSVVTDQIHSMKILKKFNLSEKEESAVMSLAGNSHIVDNLSEFATKSSKIAAGTNLADATSKAFGETFGSKNKLEMAESIMGLLKKGKDGNYYAKTNLDIMKDVKVAEAKKTEDRTAFDNNLLEARDALSGDDKKSGSAIARQMFDMSGNTGGTLGMLSQNLNGGGSPIENHLAKIEQNTASIYLHLTGKKESVKVRDENIELSSLKVFRTEAKTTKIDVSHSVSSKKSENNNKRLTHVDDSIVSHTEHRRHSYDITKDSSANIEIKKVETKKSFETEAVKYARNLEIRHTLEREARHNGGTGAVDKESLQDFQSKLDLNVGVSSPKVSDMSKTSKVGSSEDKSTSSLTDIWGQILAVLKEINSKTSTQKVVVSRG